MLQPPEHGCTTLNGRFAEIAQVIKKTDKVAVIGDGKLGLLVAQALIVLKEVEQLTHFGRHQEKLGLVSGTKHVIVDDDTRTQHSQVSSGTSCYWHPMKG